MRRFILIAILLLVSAPLWAQTSITFGWDPHPQSADISGFRLYAAKQSNGYGTTPMAIFSGGATVQGTVTSPTQPGRWYFILRAYITDGTTVIESENSNEISTVIKPKPPSGLKTIVTAPIAAVAKIADLLIPDKGLRIK